MKALLPSESAQAYEELVNSHIERHAPATDEEQELVQLVADNMWRLLRVAREEVGMCDLCRTERNESLVMEESDPVRREFLKETAIAIIMEKRLHNLRLHERRIRKEHADDLAKLKAIQTERIEKPKREAKEAVEENAREVARLMEIHSQAKMYSSNKFDPAEFGFDFTHAEFMFFKEYQSTHHLLSKEFLDLKKVIAFIRATPDKHKIA